MSARSRNARRVFEEVSAIGSDRVYALLTDLEQLEIMRSNGSEVSCEQRTPAMSDDRVHTALNAERFERDCAVRQLHRVVSWRLS